MRKLATIVLAIAVFAGTVIAQKQAKPWAEWSKKDVERILNDSPWGQTQTETDTSQMFYSPTSDPNRSRSTSNDSSRLNQGATNQAVSLNFHIRFFSAKPIRQAIARTLVLNQSNMPKDTIAKLTAWSEVHTDDWIIVAVTFDSTDQRYTNVGIQAFSTVTTELAKNNTYLERKDGQRVFLSQYEPPGKDGSGAKFVFARVLDGKPFLGPESGEVRFHSEFSAGSNAIKLDRRFKVADMLYDGKLEY